MSKNLLIFEFSPGSHIIYTVLTKSLWQPTMVLVTNSL